mgnify:CR=1 FL=1
MRPLFVMAFAMNLQSMPMSAHLKLGMRATTAEGGKVTFEQRRIRGRTVSLARLMVRTSGSPGMTLDVDAERAWIAERIRSVARPGSWEKLQAYLGSPVPVLGLTTPQLRAIHGEFRKRHPDVATADANALAAALWATRIFEEKAFAIGLLGRQGEALDERSWSLMDSWVDEATGWALSDGLASGPVSAMVRAKPARFREVLRWTKAESYWRRRASTYALNDLVRAGELDKPLQLLERLLYDPEFWVQRAVGTWLRECWKQDAGRTETFLRKHANGLPPVTITVATERASKEFREELRRKSKASRAKPR